MIFLVSCKREELSIIIKYSLRDTTTISLLVVDYQKRISIYYFYSE